MLEIHKILWLKLYVKKKENEKLLVCKNSIKDMSLETRIIRKLSFEKSRKTLQHRPLLSTENTNFANYFFLQSIVLFEYKFGN